MEDFIKDLFKKRFGKSAKTIAPLRGDGSHRKIYRVASGKTSVIGVANSDRPENAAFIAFSKHFKKCGLPVPAIYAEDAERGIYLEEDLGDTTLFGLLSETRSKNGLPKPALELYRKAAKLLPEFQIRAGKTLDYKFCYPRASFDRQSIKWDLNHFKYYFLQLGRVPFHEQSLENDFNKFTEFLLRARRDYFLYRDFQSRNIMVKGGKPYFIDYQGGRKGALQYDIASLLYDAKADLPQRVRDELLELYIERACPLAGMTRAEFMKHYHGFVYVRIMQACGAYGLRGFYEKKTHFLQSIPYAVQNLEYLLRSAELPVKLPALTQVLRNIVASSYLRQFGKAELRLTVRVESFSYRKGVPSDEKGHGGGFVFDCRALSNPGRQAEFSRLTGKDRAVREFLDGDPAVARFLSHVFKLAEQTVENYQKRNFTDLLVAFGCTGGQHRSVYCAERLAEHLRRKYELNVEVLHREQPALNAP